MSLFAKLGRATGLWGAEESLPVRKTLQDERHAQADAGTAAYSGIKGAVHGEVWPRSDVTPRTAIRVYRVVPSVYTVINKKADMLSAAPLKLYRKDSRTGEKVEHTTGVIAGLIQQPNLNLTRTQLIREIMIWLDITGRAYVAIEQRGTKFFFTVLESDFVHVVTDPETKVRAYVYDINGNRDFYPFDSVAEFENFNPGDYYFGLSAIEPLSRDIEAERYTKQYLTAQMKRGNMRGGVMETTKVYDDEELLKLKAEWKNRKADSSRVLFPPNGMKFVPFSEGNGDGLPKEILDISFDSVCLAYNMHPILFGHSNVTRPESIDIIESFVWNTHLIPLSNYISEVMTNKFSSLVGSNFFFAFDLSEIAALKRDEVNQARRDVAYGTMGYITVNEWREANGKKPFRGAGLPEWQVAFGEMPLPVWEAYIQAQMAAYNASLAPTRNADGSVSPGSGVGSIGNGTSPSLPMPGSAGGRRDQSSSTGEAEMVDTTGQRSMDILMEELDNIVTKSSRGFLAKLQKYDELFSKIDD